MGQLRLLPGTPDDNNRDYLPERIRGSDIVVNENGNNSQPLPRAAQGAPRPAHAGRAGRRLV